MWPLVFGDRRACQRLFIHDLVFNVHFTVSGDMHRCYYCYYIAGEGSAITIHIIYKNITL